MYGCNLSVMDGSELDYRPEEKIELPEEYSYMNYMPEVLDQGQDPLCVPSSISAYVNWKMNLKDGGDKLRDIGLWDIYNSKEIEGEGMTFKEAFKYMEETGAEIDGEGRFFIGNYAKVGNFFALRHSIISNGPAMCVLPVTNEYGVDDFWKDKYGDIKGFHAVALVGYDKDGFILRNSWGTSFGRNGYAHFPISDFGRIRELWTIL